MASLPHKKSIDPRSSRPLGMQGRPSRLQRRKQASRRKTSIQPRVWLISNSGTDRVDGGRGRRVTPSESAKFSSNATFDAQSHGRQMFLQSIVEACAANVAVLDESGNILYVSKSWRLSAERHCLQFGRHPLDRNYLERRTGPRAGRAGHTAALAEDIQDILDGKVTEFHNEYSCADGSGSNWFVVHAARLDLPGATGNFRVLVNSADITRARQTEEALRDLGGRLITAQEEERSRVARELHDDLNQRMALLSVELEQLSQNMPASQSNLRSSIHSVWERAQEISSEIHRVSYQLHPSKLDHLGLVAAARSLCQELANHHEIKISFKEKGCYEPLPKDVTLCLFRIVQESLRNVIKHSGAPEAKVTLAGAADVIHLSVSDTGRGFDARSLESKGGLGLISMRERLRLVGGVISIHSTAHGTKIEVSVPLSGANSRPAEKSLPEISRSSYHLAPTSVNA
jgi:signal transduction histidine kinase